jgi:hypothetical protein
VLPSIIVLWARYAPTLPNVSSDSAGPAVVSDD